MYREQRCRIEMMFLYCDACIISSLVLINLKENFQNWRKHVIYTRALKLTRKRTPKRIIELIVIKKISAASFFLNRESRLIL